MIRSNDAMSNSDRDKQRTSLGRFLGSDAAADLDRRRIQQRQREDALRSRYVAEHDDPKEGSRTEIQQLLSVALPEMIRCEVQRIRAELPEMIEAEVRRILAEELSEAVYYVLENYKQESRNGTTQASRG